MESTTIITMKNFKESLNSTKSYFGVKAVRSQVPIINDIKLWFTNFLLNTDCLPMRKCELKSNSLIFTDDNEEKSWLYFDQKNEKRKFYYMQNDNNCELYLMECHDNGGNYTYMGYIIKA